MWAWAIARPTALEIPIKKCEYQLQTWFHRSERLTLTKGTGGNLNARGNTNFGVTGGDRVNLTELLEVLHGDFVASKVKKNVLESTTENTNN